MHSPLSMQELAHLREASGPSPVRRISSTPAMTSCGLASIPAGATDGQTSTHAPHLVQAASMSSMREANAVSKVRSFIERVRCCHPKGNRSQRQSPGAGTDAGWTGRLSGGGEKRPQLAKSLLRRLVGEIVAAGQRLCAADVRGLAPP